MLQINEPPYSLGDPGGGGEVWKGRGRIERAKVYKTGEKSQELTFNKLVSEPF